MVRGQSISEKRGRDVRRARSIAPRMVSAVLFASLAGRSSTTFFTTHPASSPPRARRQRRRRSSSGTGIAVDPQDELQQRQGFFERLLVDCSAGGARRRGGTPDLLQQTAPLDRAETRKGAAQHRQDLQK